MGADEAADNSHHISLLLKALPLTLQHSMAALSVLPSTFDEEAAAAVMTCSLEQTAGILRVLYAHGLLLHNSTRGEAYMHMAVRQIVDSMSNSLPGMASR